MDNARTKKLNAAFGYGAVFFCALLVIVLTFALVFFIAFRGLAIFGNGGVSLTHFLFSTRWNPDGEPPQLGVLVFIIGSLMVSLLGIAISAPLSISVAIFMTEIAPKWGAKYLQPAIELLAGIPSVVYGWIGLSVLVPFIRNHIGGLGFSVLAGGLVLAIMMLPTISVVAIDAIRALPRELSEASLALGTTRWQTIWHILLPVALPGLLTAVILGFARGMGEALAVQMVIGNVIQVPRSLLDGVHTMTSIITMDMGNTVMGTLHNNALWSIALLLLLISFLFIVVIRGISKRRVYQ